MLSVSVSTDTCTSDVIMNLLSSSLLEKDMAKDLLSFLIPRVKSRESSAFSGPCHAIFDLRIMGRLTPFEVLLFARYFSLA
jgi:hypothetical protein